MEALRAALANDGHVSLDLAALDAATIEYPGLAAEPYLALLDEQAEAIRVRLPAGAGGQQFVETVNDQLFQQAGFRGNEAEYEDPRNSCLNEVLTRKLGIPITLSVVYIEVSRRLRRPVFGIGLPGHFVVQYDDDAYSTFIDPFHGGRLLTVNDCRELAREIAGVDINEEPALLRPVTTQYILVRMLNNLRSAYFRKQEYHKALTAIDPLTQAFPDAPENYKWRGVAQLRLRHFAAALSDFNLYLTYAPNAQDRDEIRKNMKAIHRWLGSVN